MLTNQIAPLANVAALLSLIETVQNRELGLPGMATFYGPSGWGKTTAVSVAANEFQAAWVQVKETTTKGHLGRSIMRELSLEPVRAVPDMVDAIGVELAKRGRPLILDDAQYLLRGQMIGMVRDIYENCQMPVILVGEEKMPNDLTKWENVYNRMLAWEPAAPCNFDDAKHLTKIYARGIEVDDDILKAVVDAAGGSIRRVATNLNRIKEFARARSTKSVSLQLWGDRSFDTGQPPQRPRAAQSLVDARIVHLDPKRAAK